MYVCTVAVFIIRQHQHGSEVAQPPRWDADAPKMETAEERTNYLCTYSKIAITVLIQLWSCFPDLCG